jgi:hypothetical protein
VSESILVRYDYADHVPVELPAAYVTAIEAFEGHPLVAAR